MFEDALHYPRRGDDALVTILVGGLLPLLGVLLAVPIALFPPLAVFLLLPQVFLYGYLVAVVRERLDGVEEPPTWRNWGQLLVDGVKMFLVTLGYAIPAVAAWLLGLVLLAVLTVGRPDTAEPRVAVALVVLGLLAFTAVYALAAAYVVPAGVVNFVREERLGAAFSLGTLRAVTVDTDYTVGWGLAVVAVFLGGVAAGALSLTIIGVLLVPFVLFYAQVSAVYLFTEGYVESLGLERGVASPDERPEVETSNEVAVKGAEVYPAIEEVEADDTETRREE